jgi:FkbM family methyltransferase
MEKLKRTISFILEHPFGKKNPVKCFARLLYWQLQSNLFPHKYFIKQFVGPVKFYVKKGQTGLTGNIYTGLHEFNDMAFLLHLLRPGDSFFDIGANAGSYTLLAAGICKAKTVAVEASGKTFANLISNITLNQLAVNAVHAAAGPRTGRVAFSIDEDTTNHIVQELAGNRQKIEEVEMFPIDDLLGYKPILVKIDVEGYETEVLKGMTETLAGNHLKAIIIELNGSGRRYGFDEQSIHDLLLSYGFQPHTYDPVNRSLTVAATYGSYNTIYCRDILFIEERLKNSARFKVMGQLI